MKAFSVFVPAGIAVLLSAAIFTIPQAPAPQAGGPQPGHEHEHIPTPTNLKVLPKNLTGDQVHDIMHGWSDGLGVHCDTCHVEDPGKIGRDGRPELNFADDSKPEKLSARIMYTMTQDINKNYVSKLEDPGKPITCGTCHRGHLKPEAFVAPHQAHRTPGAQPPAQKPPIPR